MKKIKPCELNLLIALRATAKAHKVKFEDWADEGQVGIKSESIPVVSDVMSILRAFLKPDYTLPDVGWGFTTIYLYGQDAYLDEVDEMTLTMALPYNCKPRWKRV